MLEFNGEVRPPANVLASRYASPEMVANFSDEAKIWMERDLWIEIMRNQAGPQDHAVIVAEIPEPSMFRYA